MQENKSFMNDKQNDNLDLRDLTERYILQWKWFVFGVTVCLILALLYLRYTIPIYSASATILVKDEKKGGLQSELAAFSDLGLMTGVKSNVDNEIEVIKSRTIVKKAIKKLGFNITYQSEGRVKTFEEYNERPIDFNFYNYNESFYSNRKFFVFNSKDVNEFELLYNGKDLGKFKYGSIINLEDSKLVVNKNLNNYSKKPNNFTIQVNVNNIDNITESYKARLNIAALSKNSSVVALTINDPVKEKAIDFLDAIIEVYNEDAIADKKFISENTLNFIQDRLKIITSELGDVEIDAESFKKSNRVTDIVSEAGLYLQNSVDFERALIETETQIKVINSMKEFMKTKPKWDLVPSNILSKEGDETSQLIIQHNDLIIQRNRIAKEGTSKNSIVANLEQKIDDLNRNISENLSRVKSTLIIKKGDLEKQENLIKSKISQIPTQEREFRIIDRQQKIKESLYLYLLQKREETAITLAVTAPISKIIDPAFASGNPVSPKRNIIFLLALALGILIPFTIIYIIDLFDNKIKYRQDVEGKISVPFLGDIPKSESQDEIINASSRSSSAEAIRIIRTNLEFMLTKVQEGSSKTIFVTSSIPKEGKTFVAINLASTIALSGKKVLLIGLDIRNPKIDRYVKLPSKGLTNYLSKSNEKYK